MNAVTYAETGSMDLDLQAIAERARMIASTIEDGQDQLASRLVLARLLTPLLQIIDAMDSDRSGRWRTVAEAIRESGRSRNYFEKPQASLGGRVPDRAVGS
jgi:hypothetical protein